MRCENIAQTNKQINTLESKRAHTHKHTLFVPQKCLHLHHPTRPIEVNPEPYLWCVFVTEHYVEPGQATVTFITLMNCAAHSHTDSGVCILLAGFFVVCICVCMPHRIVFASCYRRLLSRYLWALPHLAQCTTTFMLSERAYHFYRHLCNIPGCLRLCAIRTSRGTYIIVKWSRRVVNRRRSI